MTLVCYHARWVVPVASDPVEDGTVAVDNRGSIAYVGPRSTAPLGEPYDLGSAILLPGLVNVHTHLELTAMRGLLEDLDFPDWIDSLRYARNTALVGDALVDSSRLGVAEGLERGVTTFADTSSSGASMEAMLEMGVRGIMYQETFGPHPDTCSSSMSALKTRVAELRPLESDLVWVGISPHAPYTVSEDLYREAAHFARAEKLPVAMHISESHDEDRYVRLGIGGFAERLKKRDIKVVPRGRSPIALLESLGALSEKTLLIHAVQADEDDIDIMARNGCAVAHCPVSNAKLGHGIAPLRGFLDAGLRVGLGSDSVASNNKMDILEEARSAVIFQNAVLKSPRAVSAQAALELATINGARALNLDHLIGSLEVGKRADIVAFPIGDPATTPSQNPVATAVYSLGGAKASFVAIEGRRLVEDGKLSVSSGTASKSLNSIAQALARTLPLA